MLIALIGERMQYRREVKGWIYALTRCVGCPGFQVTEDCSQDALFMEGMRFLALSRSRLWLAKRCSLNHRPPDRGRPAGAVTFLSLGNGMAQPLLGGIPPQRVLAVKCLFNCLTATLMQDFPLVAHLHTGNGVVPVPVVAPQMSANHTLSGLLVRISRGLL